MVQSLNNQVVLGKREWLILTDNNKPKPVEKDGQPLSDKPLKKKLRESSGVDEEYNNDENVVGYMGDDEDVQQAQYNVMSLIENKIGNLDNEIDRITRELDILVQKNKDEIQKNKDDIEELKEERCINFLHDNCDGSQTPEGCIDCAKVNEEQGELPENCLGYDSRIVRRFCNYSSPSPSPPNDIDIEGLANMYENNSFTQLNSDFSIKGNLLNNKYSFYETMISGDGCPFKWWALLLIAVAGAYFLIRLFFPM